MMMLVCPKCQLAMSAVRTGVGAEAKTSLGPQQLYMADVYECPECHSQILAGFNHDPISPANPAYQEKVARYQQRGDMFRFWRSNFEKGALRDVA